MKRSNNETVSIREAAQRRGCTLRWIYDQVWAGRLPAQKIGGQWRIPLSAVNERIGAKGAA